MLRFSYPRTLFSWFLAGFAAICTSLPKIDFIFETVAPFRKTRSITRFGMINTPDLRSSRRVDWGIVSNACHYWRIFVQCLSLTAYICPMHVPIGVCLSNAGHYQFIVVQ